jgi:hypothetical protein
LGVNEIGFGHRDVPLVVSSDFEAIEDDVKITAIQRRDELIPLVLDHSGLDP